MIGIIPNIATGKNSNLETVILEADFNGYDVPAEFTAGTNASIVDNILQVTGAGNSYMSVNNSMKVQSVIIDFVLQSTDLLFRPYKEPEGSSAGCICDIDFDNMLLILRDRNYEPYTTLPDIILQESITITKTIGHIYIAELQMGFPDFFRLSLKNINTGESQYIEASSAVFRDFPGFSVAQGSMDINKFSLLSRTSQRIKTIVYGDSLTDGYTIENTLARWGYLLYEELNQKCVIHGRGSADSAMMLDRIDYDLAAFDSDFFQIMIGTNDSVYATWLSNLQAIIAKIETAGMFPILTTMPPRADRQAFLNSANSWILSSGYTYIDFAYVLTVGGDRVTWISGYVQGDGIHPTESAQEVMLQEIKDKVGNLYGI